MRGVQPGLTFWFIVRLVLDRCATVEEALPLMQAVPHTGSWSYLLADAHGHAAVVEPTTRGVAVRYPERGLLVATNHALCPQWACRESYVSPDSHVRYQRLQDLLGAGQSVDAEVLKAALRDHQGMLCSHAVRFPRRSFGTLWFLVGRPGECQLELASGTPCRCAYETLTF